MKVEVVVWGMSEGVVTELQLGEQVFVLRREAEVLVVPKQVEDMVEAIAEAKKTITRKAKRKRGIRISDLEKWIKKGNFKTFFLEDFFKVFPKQRKNSRLGCRINDLINKRVICQFNDREGTKMFRVIR